MQFAIQFTDQQNHTIKVSASKESVFTPQHNFKYLKLTLAFVQKDSH